MTFHINNVSMWIMFVDSFVFLSVPQRRRLALDVSMITAQLTRYSKIREVYVEEADRCS